MAAPDLCIPCMSLVGASRQVDPHPKLKHKKQTGKDEFFQCAACDAWWAIRPLGWDRVVR